MIDEVIYIRTSTTEQKPENQINDCEKLCKGEYRLLKDEQSAFTDLKERPGFEELKKLIKNKQVHSLIVWDLDRIFRNRIRLKEFFEFCKLYKCKISSYNQQWLEELNKIPSPFNDIMYSLMLDLMGWLAEDESKKKSARVKLAVRRVEGKPTKSYRGKRWGRKAINLKVKQEIINLRGQGLSIREIADSVFIWDKNSNRKKISKSFVHKTLQEVKV